MLARQWFTTFTGLLSLTLLFLLNTPGSSAAPYYQGKTLTVIQARTPGGTGDVRVRVGIRYLQKYLPGNPTIVSRYMPGGGGAIAANYLANVAKRDGLTIANVGSSMFANAILGVRGVRYKLDDFVFLGSASPGNPYTLVIRPGLNLDTVEKVKAYKGLRFAQRSVGHSMYIIDRLMAYVLELKDPQWILGYSSPEVRLAVERGEADAESTGLPGFMRATPHWLNEGFAFPVVMKNSRGRGAEIIPKFKQDSPTLDQYADTELKRAVLRFDRAIRGATNPFLVPKGVPLEALKALREAFNKIWSDPHFPEDYTRATAGEPADPMTGEEIDQMVRNRPKNPEIMKLYKQLISGGPLPSGK